MNSFEKTISLLSLFSDQARQLSVEEMAERTGLPIASLYRYIQNLQKCGLLVPVRPGVMSLGPRIAELDRLMRISDPLLVASDVVFPKVLNNIRPSALLLSRYAGNEKILTVRAETTQEDGHAQGYLRERGIPYSSLWGASSLVILAHRSEKTIRDAYRSDPECVRRRRMGDNLAEFKTYLAAIKKQGYASTQNTFRTGRASVAIPIFDEAGYAEASLARTFDEARFAEIGVAPILADLKAILQQITVELQRKGSVPFVSMAAEVSG